MSKRKPPTPPEVFERHTSIVPGAVFRTVLERDYAHATPPAEEIAWLSYAYSTILRTLDANNPRTHKRLRSPGDLGRSFAYNIAASICQRYFRDTEKFRADFEALHGSLCET
jgi:hypothetical protein